MIITCLKFLAKNSCAVKNIANLQMNKMILRMQLRAFNGWKQFCLMEFWLLLLLPRSFLIFHFNHMTKNILLPVCTQHHLWLEEISSAKRGHYSRAVPQISIDKNVVKTLVNTHIKEFICMLLVASPCTFKASWFPSQQKHYWYKTCKILL